MKPFADIDLANPDSFVAGVPHEWFARLRREAPVYWHPEPDGPGFWVAGDRGIGFARLGTPPLHPLRQGDLPAPANDLTVNGDYLWVATDAGLVRFRLDAIRP